MVTHTMLSMLAAGCNFPDGCAPPHNPGTRDSGPYPTAAAMLRYRGLGAHPNRLHTRREGKRHHHALMRPTVVLVSCRGWVKGSIVTTHLALLCRDQAQSACPLEHASLVDYLVRQILVPWSLPSACGPRVTQHVLALSMQAGTSMIPMM